MFTINIKSFFSIIISKTTLFLCEKLLKGGTNFPGKVALKLDNKILKQITKGYKVILVTGTNGKTTTTSMIYNVLKNSGKNVITNASGANMLTGIVACFIKNYKFFNKEKEKYAVIEVDEANVKFITPVISPEIITVTNLFRDQLDRFGEVYTTLEKILEGINHSPSTNLVLNGDEPLLGNLKVNNNCTYFGFTYDTGIKNVDINAEAKFCKVCQKEYEYNFVTYNHLGDFYCPNCSFKRPNLDYAMDSLINKDYQGTSFTLNGVEAFINQSGIYNIYNALCAYAVCDLLNVPSNDIISALESSKSSFGRQEIINIMGKDVKIFLVKNPAGYNEAINVLDLDNRVKSCAFLLNDNYADGRDVSWIWDVKFESLSNNEIKELAVGGVRAYDMATRLKISGLDIDSNSICENYDALLKKIQESESDIFYIFATYTAMTSLRKYFQSKNFIDKLWE
ncbi:Mur ligase family protein [Oceanirhabdus sp. W0125-5]|uniref:Mur ligase family protein n=1 Tax=Oceanirhabdus sp. W0125-5 TaxID=2999116 RepID=UPI0022F2E479|nr:Mur ligase family protein [Oceanirhabdus sp. W0125-5]WBW98695.1 Mur ligase family protein [Oceanirhabdus sp. W0125-5]